jgi:hypothetical protein
MLWIFERFMCKKEVCEGLDTPTGGGAQFRGQFRQIFLFLKKDSNHPSHRGRGSKPGRGALS